MKYLKVIYGVFQKVFSKKPQTEMEKRIDTLSSVVERNKMKNSGEDINDVIASARRQSVKYKVYY